MSFKVTIQNSGKTFTTNSNESVLDAALHQGIVIAYSCKNGSCASCQGRIIQGSVHYEDPESLVITQEQMNNGAALFCQAHATSDLIIAANEIKLVENIPVKILPSRVIEKTLLSSDVMRLLLKLPQHQHLKFLAGQYIDIIQKNGYRRTFSIASPPHIKDQLELHVRLVANGEFTQHVFSELKEKTIIRFAGPLGTFFIRKDQDRPRLLMAGGTGFAPIKSMVEQLIYEKNTAPIHIFWGVRSKQDLYAHELIESWCQQYQHINYTPVLSDPMTADQWQGKIGFVHEALLAQYPNLANYDVYMSGPPAMIDIARKIFIERGLPKDRLFYDSFDFAPEAQQKIRNNS